LARRVLIAVSLVGASRTASADKNFLAIGGQELAKAPCLSPPPTTPEIQNWLVRRFEGQARASRTVHGGQLANQPQELLRIFEELVTAATDEPDPPFTTKRLDLSHCTTVFCGLQTLYGLDAGLRLAYLRARFGMNVSSLASRSLVVKEWKVTELNELIQALEDLPPHFFPFTENPRYFFRRRDARGTVAANAGLGVFDAWAAEKPGERRAILSHEIAHMLSRNVFDKSETWQQLGRWKRLGGEKWQSGAKNASVSYYAETNPFEDFAESFIAYRYRPELLRSASPGKYAYLSTYLFGGLDYADGSACSRRAPFAEEAARFAQELPQLPFAADIPLGEKECAAEWSAFVAGLIRQPKIDTRRLAGCLSAGALRSAFEARILATIPGGRRDLLAVSPAFQTMRLPPAEWPAFRRTFDGFVRDWLANSMSRYLANQILVLRSAGTACPNDPYAANDFLDLEGPTKDAMRSIVLANRELFSKLSMTLCERLKETGGDFPPKAPAVREYFFRP